MKHRRAVRNHPAADVVVGVVLEVIAVTLLIQQVRRDTFWGALFAALLVAGSAPWTWWAITYLLHGPGREVREELELHGPQRVAAYDGSKTAAHDSVLVFDQDTMDISEPLPTFDQIRHSVREVADRLADDLDAVGGSYTGDPRLAPGFWKQEDGETDDEYWRRLCGHDGPSDKGHLIMCPDWIPR
jgi:hypothetical protein